MRKIIKVLVVTTFLAGCNDDFLDRTPLSEISPESSFNTAKDLELFTNSFYNSLPDWNTIVEKDNLSDNLLFNGVPLEQTGERLVPAESGSNGWNWAELRTINFFLENYERSSDEFAKKEYSGVAYFFRAYFYFEKLKQFGDVPWYDQVIGSQDTELLQKPRDSRVKITEMIIQDLDKAIVNLNTSKSSDRVNKWTALALKSRVALYEGTFRKYHSSLSLSGASELLELSYQASQELMTEGPYSLYNTGSSNTDYRDLFASDNANEDEIILCRRYSVDLNVVSNTNYFFTASTQKDIGLTKSIVNSYLMDDGSPFTNQVGFETMGFLQENENRDARLSQTVRMPGHIRIGGSSPVLPTFDASMSGYQVVKFVGDASQDGFQESHSDMPIFRFGEVLLNFAEAKAELGILTQVDLDASIGLLRSRGGMPNLNLSNANDNVDPVLQSRYPNVSGTNTGVVLEIRRERRIELVLEGFRYDDLMRWKNGKTLEEHFTGMYFPSLGEFDLDGNGTIDVILFEGELPGSSASQSIEIGSVMELTNGTSGNLVPFMNRVKKFDESRDYLYPIPSGDILLNPNLTQNPNW